MLNTGYPYEGFEDMFPQTKPTPEWVGFGHKHYEYHRQPVRHLILADGQHRSELWVRDPDGPIDQEVADVLRGAPAERAPWPVSNILTINRTERPGARWGMETGQFEQPDTRPGVVMHHRRGR